MLQIERQNTGGYTQACYASKTNVSLTIELR